MEREREREKKCLEFIVCYRLICKSSEMTNNSYFNDYQA